MALQRKGENGRASAPLRRAGRSRTTSIDHPTYARTLNLMAQQFWFEGHLNESRRTSEQALAVAERTLRPDHPTVAESLRYLAATFSDLGDLTQSVQLRERALVIAERNFVRTTMRRQRISTHWRLPSLAKGRTQPLESASNECFASFNTGHGPRHDFVAATLLMLALVDASLGDYTAARREQTRAITVYEQVDGPNHP